MRWMCEYCGHVYDEDEGDEASGVPAGTHFGDLPEDWTCPECGRARTEFELA